jgi:hypothetical protein
MNKCPYCGAPLPEEAAFCPSCARSISERREVAAPKPVLGKLIRFGVPILLICAIAVCVFLYTRPKTYDSGEAGQVVYVDGDTEYQLLINQFQENRYTPLAYKEQAAEQDGDYRVPVRLFVNRLDDGADLTEEFMAKVDHASAEIIQLTDNCPPPRTWL